MQIGPSAATDKESLLLVGKEGGPVAEIYQKHWTPAGLPL